MIGKWILLTYAKNEQEAYIIKGKLEVEGIPILIQQEAIGEIYKLTTDGLGEIKILVPRALKNKAEKILLEE